MKIRRVAAVLMGPFARGIYVTLQARLKSKTNSDEIAEMFRSAYQGAPFVPLGVDSLRRNIVPHDSLRCTFLAVGHGTCVVIEMPDGRVLVYDAGRMGLPQTGGRLVSSYLWHRGIHHVDALVISHADADHYNAVPDLLERFSVGTVFVSPVMFRDADPGVEFLRNSLRKAATGSLSPP